jgi:50S ribosomal subunit-associated GTPase HflX
MDSEGRGGRRRRITGVIAALRHRDERSEGTGEAPVETEIESLKRRVDHLEATLEGLQDSVYRETQRHDAELQELHKQLLPGAMSQAIEADARRRGL